MNPTPFRVDVEPEALVDLKRRLAQTRWPSEVSGVGWERGTPLAELRGLVDYWRGGFDWRRAEAQINGFNQWSASVDGQSIHFIHERGRGPSPMALLLNHGWPGSFLEMLDLIPLLVDPATHGADAADAFDVVVPSMPGYGFSPAPREPGMNPIRIADLWAWLMDGLGYSRFGTQGGDWGASISTRLACSMPST